MAAYTKASTKTIKKMEEDYSNGQTTDNMMENGKMESSTEKDNTWAQTVR